MPPFVHRLGVQISAHPSPSVSTRLALFCVLLGTFCLVTRAQTYTQGLPTVGNNTPIAAPSQVFIDATQFGTSADDMCAKIADACAKLGTANYPLGATIDARGFTGNQVCAATNITKMLNSCSPQGSENGATGGKLLLGEVNLYADGPAGGVNGNYSDWRVAQPFAFFAKAGAF